MKKRENEIRKSDIFGKIVTFGGLKLNRQNDKKKSDIWRFENSRIVIMPSFNISSQFRSPQNENIKKFAILMSCLLVNFQILPF